MSTYIDNAVSIISDGIEGMYLDELNEILPELESLVATAKEALEAKNSFAEAFGDEDDWAEGSVIYTERDTWTKGDRFAFSKWSSSTGTYHSFYEVIEEIESSGETPYMVTEMVAIR